MPMTNHVTSLEISKQLKEADWKKETEFVWGLSQINDEDKNPKWEIFVNEEESFDLGLRSFYPAPLATEILEELPDLIRVKKLHYIFTLYKRNKYLDIIYQGIGEDSGSVPNKTITDKSLLNALAKMWIYLKKEGLIK